MSVRVESEGREGVCEVERECEGGEGVRVERDCMECKW